MTHDQIRDIFLAHGFTIKEGQTDLKDYVYSAARALLAERDKQLSTFCQYCGGNDEIPQDHCTDCQRPTKLLTDALYCLEAWQRGCEFDDYWRDVSETMASLRKAIGETS